MRMWDPESRNFLVFEWSRRAGAAGRRLAEECRESSNAQGHEHLEVDEVALRDAHTEHAAVVVEAAHTAPALSAVVRVLASPH